MQLWTTGVASARGSAHTAQEIVMWYSARPHVGLWILLIALPLGVFVIGAASLLSSWNADPQLRQAARQTFGAMRAHLATVLIAAATLTAGVVLACIGLHVLSD